MATIRKYKGAMKTYSVVKGEWLSLGGQRELL